MFADEDQNANVEQWWMLLSSSAAHKVKTPHLMRPLFPQLTAAELGEWRWWLDPWEIVRRIYLPLVWASWISSSSTIRKKFLLQVLQIRFTATQRHLGTCAMLQSLRETYQILWCSVCQIRVWGWRDWSENKLEQSNMFTLDKQQLVGWECIA